MASQAWVGKPVPGTALSSLPDDGILNCKRIISTLRGIKDFDADNIPCLIIVEDQTGFLLQADEVEALDAEQFIGFA